jgi:hypothetical protein
VCKGASPLNIQDGDQGLRIGCPLGHFKSAQSQELNVFAISCASIEIGSAYNGTRCSQPTSGHFKSPPNFSAYLAEADNGKAST